MINWDDYVKIPEEHVVHMFDGHAIMGGTMFDHRDGSESYIGEVDSEIKDYIDTEIAPSVLSGGGMPEGSARFMASVFAKYHAFDMIEFIMQRPIVTSFFDDDAGDLLSSVMGQVFPVGEGVGSLVGNKKIELDGYCLSEYGFRLSDFYI